MITYLYVLLLGILVLGSAHLFIKLFSPIYASKSYLYSRVTLLLVLGTLFTLGGQMILNRIVRKLADSMDHIKNSKTLENGPEVMAFYNNKYALKQIHKLKIVIYLFYFTICYTGLKTVFFFLLNEDVPGSLQEQGRYRVSLYNDDDFIWYSSQNDFEQSFLKYTELLEYSFRILLGFVLPIYYIMGLIRNECKTIIRVPNVSRSSEGSLKDLGEQEEVIKPFYGLRFS